MSEVEAVEQTEFVVTIFVSVWADDVAEAARLGERMAESIESSDGVSAQAVAVD